MPTKTPRDEEKWQKAKDLAAEAGKPENFAYIMGIYKKMKPDYEFKTEEGKPKRAQSKLTPEDMVMIRYLLEEDRDPTEGQKKASGYRVWTVGELRALPEGTVLEKAGGVLFVKSESHAGGWLMGSPTGPAVHTRAEPGGDLRISKMSTAEAAVSLADVQRDRVDIPVPGWSLPMAEAIGRYLQTTPGLRVLKQRIQNRGVSGTPDLTGWSLYPRNSRITIPLQLHQLARKANSNAKIVEVPNTFHPVKVEPPRKKREKFPFEGYIDFQGIQIDVENVKGSTRSGTGPEGDWSVYMHAHYGEIRGTEGTDGDMLDVYVGDNHDSSLVLVVHQHNPWDGKYDEDKVVLGCESVEEAIGLFKKQYDRPGFFREGEYTVMPIGAFWRWVKDTRNKGKKVKVARTLSARLRWQQIRQIDPAALAVARRFRWVRIRSNGDMGLTVAARLPNGRWNVQSVADEDQFDHRNIKGRPKTDNQLLQLYKAQGGSSPAVLVDSERATPPNQPAPEKPGLSQGLQKPTAVQFTMQDVARRLNRLVGRTQSSQQQGSVEWVSEPPERKRLDHYVGSFDFRDPDDDLYDPEGWNDDAWQEEYAEPLLTKTLRGLEEHFGKKLFDVDIGEKGFVYVSPTPEGYKALGMAVPSRRWKKGYVEGSLGSLNTAKEQLTSLLAYMRALQWNHLTSHWQVAGDSSYGDHLLFERLYGALGEEIDTLAEKLVGLFGMSAVDPRVQAGVMSFVLNQWGIDCPFERSLKAERGLQVHLQKCRDALEDMGQLTLGMDDYLAATASTHETHIYLIQQRMGGVRVANLLSVSKKEHQAVRAFLVRSVLKFAASVGTDTAAIYAIAPEMLSKLISGPWGSRYTAGDYEAANTLVRQHGGAVFLTGADGHWDVQVPGAIREQGYTEPYGTAGFDSTISKLAGDVVRDLE